MSEHWRISPTPSPSELANQINRTFAAIKKRIDALPITAGQAVTKVQAPQTVAFDPGTPGIGGGTSVPPAAGTQVGGDVTGTLDQTVVGGIQTVPILAPSVDGTVATFVSGVPDIEWKTPVSSLIFDSQTVLTGTTLGTVTWAQIFRFVSYKVFVAFFNGYENTTGVAQTIVFPTANTQTPIFVANITPACTVSTTTLTLPINMVATTSGFVLVEGY